jgi:hypothetical protein
MPEFQVRCGSRGETSLHDLPEYPAGDICPNCKRLFGWGKDECFFTIKKVDESKNPDPYAQDLATYYAG